MNFCDYKKVLYDECTKEIFLLYWLKYKKINNQNVFIFIMQELSSVNNKGFVESFFTRLGNDIEFLLSDEQLAGTESSETEGDEFTIAVQFYLDHFGVMTTSLAESIIKWENDIGSNLVIEAMKRALKKQQVWKYTEELLKNWASKKNTDEANYHLLQTKAITIHV
ncbi:DnaD domain protein [Bacillus cihuensis]|uniref:DnaD domain protein n=1 Tax=Bacillus cihuensis TaxID=1208599 RepID=UPI0003F517DF|nr:DnaD domain protein [Bacillus cihuensis]